MNVIEGQVVRFVAQFRTAAGAYADPTTVTWRVLGPSGTTAYVHGIAIESTRSDVGRYVLALQLSAPGEWTCRAEGTGTIAACDELDRPVMVRASAMAGALP